MSLPSRSLIELYTFRKDFNYYDYLEKRSNFEDLAVSIDTSIAKSYVPIESLQGDAVQSMREITSELEQIHGSLHDIEQQAIETNAHLSSIDGKLSGIHETLEDILFSVQAGFQLVGTQLEKIEHKLNRLIEIAETPEQVWATEQLRISQDLAARGLLSDAITHLEHSISGNEAHTGYKYWPEPHFLKGLIYMGAIQSRQNNLLDLGIAKRSFENAAVYADASGEVDGRIIEFEAICNSSWCEYASGDPSAAATTLKAAIAISPHSAKPRYFRAKALLNGGDAEGLVEFKHAVELDPRYGFMAARDKDFLKYRDRVLEISQGVQSQFSSVVGELIIAAKRTDTDEISKVVRGVSVRSIAQSLPQSVRDLPLSRLFRTAKAVKQFSVDFEEATVNAQKEAKKRHEEQKQHVAQIKTHMEKSNTRQQNTKELPLPKLALMIGLPVGFAFGVANYLSGFIVFGGLFLNVLLFCLASTALIYLFVDWMREKSHEERSFREQATQTHRLEAARESLAQTKLDLELVARARQLSGQLKAATGKLPASFANTQTIEEVSHSIFSEPEVGKIYQGKVAKIVDYGAVVRFHREKEGLLHVTQIENRHVKHPSDVLNIGQQVLVKLLGFDDSGTARLSMKVVDQFSGREANFVASLDDVKEYRAATGASLKEARSFLGLE
ncbi:tetratricopeptide repeat protein [Falsiruegeria litorea]|uniref:tetratricopeptide repeat protein n=1 Tax=Falsiruegeria litorea TaxID=1280831 RepID=UPI001BFE4978|nr:S1 RNA-binding domain-containing protein [Falsiruegeria litorea]MBT8170210.1 S1 RNA-binding domain-containing protein [Falsiruegeria litorea]